MLTIRRSKADGFEEIGRDVAADLLRRGDSYLWLHFDKPKEEEIRFLQETLKIHDLTVEDIVHQNQRPSTWQCIRCAKKRGRSNPPNWTYSLEKAGSFPFTTVPCLA